MSNEKNLPYAVVCGGVNIDIGAHSFAPLRAKDSNPGKVELSLGGVGRNIAHNMRLLGVPTYLLTAVGGDSRASQVEESCKELGIDLSHALRVPDGRTSTYVFVGDSDGDMAVAVADMELCEKLTPDYFASQKELLDGAADEFDLDAVRAGKLSPVFFGSALTNFGVEPFLKEFLRLAPAPLPYTDTISGDQVDPQRKEFAGFVFKIQANMDKNHRDRIAFVRICSGKFERGMEAFHVQGGKKLKLATGTSLMADDRATVDEAYAGDIVGLFDPGIFSIGDTVCKGEHVQFPPIPTFSPEHFARITQVNTLKRKQFVKGMHELAQEGAVQIFREPGFGMESVICGVVGVLQLDVLETRLKNEYGVEVRRQGMPYTDIRWIANDLNELDTSRLNITRDTKLVEDMRGGRLLLFTNSWNVNWAIDHNPDLKLSEVGNVNF